MVEDDDINYTQLKADMQMALDFLANVDCRVLDCSKCPLNTEKCSCISNVLKYNILGDEE